MKLIPEKMLDVHCLEMKVDLQLEKIEIQFEKSDLALDLKAKETERRLATIDSQLKTLTYLVYIGLWVVLSVSVLLNLFHSK